MSQLEEIKKTLLATIEKSFGGTQRVEIKKSLNEEKKLATFVVLAPEEVDAHGDIYDAEVIEDACYSFEAKKQANIDHLFNIGDDIAKIVESYVTPVEFQLDDVLIKKGTWLQTWKFNSDVLWEDVKSGEFNGLSVQCKGLAEDL